MNFLRRNKGPDELKISNIFAFREIITIPVQAVVDANIAAAQSSLDFIRQYGFTGNTTGNKWGKLRMVSFTYNYIGNGRQQEMTVRIPVLSLIPLPLLMVDRASFKMGLQIVNQVLDADKLDPDFPLEPKELEVLTMLAPIDPREQDMGNPTLQSSNSSQLKANMNATIEVVSSDLPDGIIKLLNLFQDATEGESDDIYEIDVNPTKLEFLDDEAHEGFIQKELTVGVKLHEEAVEGQIVKIQILSSTNTPINDTFLTPIGLLEGDLIGIPSYADITARTTNEGKVKIRLRAKQKAFDNGFIRVSTGKTESVDIYYKVNEQEPILLSPSLNPEK